MVGYQLDGILDCTEKIVEAIVHDGNREDLTELLDVLELSVRIRDNSPRCFP